MFLLPAAVAAVSFVVAPDPPKPFAIEDGDRIVWIGNTLVEREQRYGYWETALHAAYPTKSFTLRNLGWSGDTVHGDARAGFDTPAKGFERLVSLTLELKPTVILVSYGQNESFDGEAGLPRFEKGLNKLLDALKPAKARIVLMTPTPFEAAAGYLTAEAAAARNTTLERYRAAIRDTAEARGLACFDVPHWFENSLDKKPFTDNGVHLTEGGYRRTAHLLPHFLPVDAQVGDTPESRTDLRAAVVAKNELFFHRWRPQNETYLFGFRKHEQGRNAKEVAEFDPLVKKAEEEIDRIKKTLTR